MAVARRATTSTAARRSKALGKDDVFDIARSRPRYRAILGPVKSPTD